MARAPHQNDPDGWRDREDDRWPIDMSSLEVIDPPERPLRRDLFPKGWWCARRLNRVTPWDFIPKLGYTRYQCAAHGLFTISELQLQMARCAEVSLRCPKCLDDVIQAWKDVAEYAGVGL